MKKEITDYKAKAEKGKITIKPVKKKTKKRKK